jgi:hypothetical protein
VDTTVDCIGACGSRVDAIRTLPVCTSSLSVQAFGGGGGGGKRLYMQRLAESNLSQCKGDKDYETSRPMACGWYRRSKSCLQYIDVRTPSQSSVHTGEHLYSSRGVCRKALDDAQVRRGGEETALEYIASCIVVCTSRRYFLYSRGCRKGHNRTGLGKAMP